MVWRLDRLGRSMRHLVAIVEDLSNRKVQFKSICDAAIDTTTASGELVFHIFSSFAQFERRLIQERTKAGLSAARARGRVGGRPALSYKNPKVQMAYKLHQDKSMEIRDICSSMGISRTTLYKYIQLAKQAG